MGLIGSQKHRFRFVCTTVGKSWLAYSRHCALIQTRSHSTFFFNIDLLTNDGVLGAISKFPTPALR